MHDTAFEHARLFFELYWRPEFGQVVEPGSQDVNGTLRDHCPPSARYLGLDMEPGRGVDLVVAPGRPLPLADGSADVVVTSSAFEHDVCFWETFRELVRILRPGGLLYVNAPSNGMFHRYPVDCWRFYPDAGIALSSWAMRNGIAVELAESFVARPGDDGWADFVAVFRRPTDRPLSRRGRISERTTAANVGAGGAPGQAALEAECAETFDMLEATSLRARIEAAEALRGRERAEAETQRGRLEAADALLRRARDEADARVAACAALRARAGSLETELAASAGHHARMEEALRAVERSTSWRVTAPLRRLSTLLHRPG
jgi:SAM-dependent methyltransferase